MERRKLLIGIGALGTGGAAAFGTEAFTSIEAERNVDVSVAGDSSAYLAFQALDSVNGNDYVTTESDDTISITLNGDGGAGGSGVNQDAVTQIEDLFKVVNQGTQSTSVYFEDDSDAVTFRVTRSTDTSTNGSNGQSLEGADNSVELDVGEQVVVGLTIDTLNNDVNGDLLDTVTVVADAGASAPGQSTPAPQYVVDGSGSQPNTFATLSNALASSDVTDGSVIGIEGSATFSESSTVTVDQSVTITGFNGMPTIDATGVSSGPVMAVDAAGVTLRNFTIKTGTNRININADDVTVDGLSTIFENNAIYVASPADGVVVENSQFSLPSGVESLGYGIRFEGATSNGVARNNFFSGITNSQSGEYGNGVIISGADGHEIVGNEFSGNSIGVNVGSVKPAGQFTVSGNSFVQQTDFAVALNHDDSNSPNFAITDNQFDNDAVGILALAGGSIDIGENDFANYADDAPYVTDSAGVLDLEAIANEQGNTFTPDAVAGNTNIAVVPDQGEVVNVDTLTYAGDGTIQTAVDSASSNETVAVGPGGFGSVDVPTDNLTIKGPNATTPYDGARTTEATVSATAERTFDVSGAGVEVTGFRIEGTDSDGVLFVNGDGSNLEGKVTVANNIIRSSGTSSQGFATGGVVLSDASSPGGPNDAEVVGNDIETGEGAAVNVFAGDTHGSVSVVSNEIRGDPGGLRNVADLTVKGNEIFPLGSPDKALDVSDITNTATITGNTFTGSVGTRAYNDDRDGPFVNTADDQSPGVSAVQSNNTFDPGSKTVDTDGDSQNDEILFD